MMTLVALVKLIILCNSTDINNKLLIMVFKILFIAIIELRLIIIMVMLYFP